jgi:hypothetical protein
MKENFILFFRKKSLVTEIICLFIFVFGFFVPSSWAAFDSTFPDNTKYEICEFESGFHGGVTGAWGANDQLYIVKATFTFMADGSLTINVANDDELNRFIGDDQNGNNTFSATYTPDSGTESGSYIISSDGIITITFDEEGEDATITGILSEDGQTVVFGYKEYNNGNMYGSVAIGVGVKKGTDFDTHLPDNTVYDVGEFESGFQGGMGGPWSDDKLYIFKARLTFMLNGDVTLNIANDDSLTRSIGDNDIGLNTFVTTYFQEETGTETGTYSISSDGTVTINLQEDDEVFVLTGVLSEEGQTFMFTFSEYNDTENEMYASLGLGVGVRKGSGFSETFSETVSYAVYEFESGFHGGTTGAWGANDELFIVKSKFTFMTDGTFTSTIASDSRLNRFIGDDQNGNNTFLTSYDSESETESGTYSISSDGEVTVTFDPGGDDEETITAVLSEDGQVVIFGYGEYEDSNMYGSFGIGIGVKSDVNLASEKKGSILSILPLILED